MSQNPSTFTPNNEVEIAQLVHRHKDPFDAVAEIEDTPGGLRLLGDPNFVEIVYEELSEKFDDFTTIGAWLADLFDADVLREHFNADWAEKFAEAHDPDVVGIYEDPRHADPDLSWADRCDENYVLSLDSHGAALQVIADCDEPAELASTFADAAHDFAGDREFLAMALVVLSTKGYDQKDSIAYLIDVFGQSCMTTLTKKDEVAESVSAES